MIDTHWTLRPQYLELLKTRIILPPAILGNFVGHGPIGPHANVFAPVLDLLLSNELVALMDPLECGRIVTWVIVSNKRVSIPTLELACWVIYSSLMRIMLWPCSVARMQLVS